MIRKGRGTDKEWGREEGAGKMEEREGRDGRREKGEELRDNEGRRRMERKEE